MANGQIIFTPGIFELVRATIQLKCLVPFDAIQVPFFSINFNFKLFSSPVAIWEATKTPFAPLSNFNKTSRHHHNSAFNYVLSSAQNL
jgi:hypothetical protein